MRMSVTTPATFEPEQPPPTGKTAILFKLFLRVFRSFGGTADKMFSMARMVVLNGRGFFAAAMAAAAGRLAAAAGRFMLTGPGELEAPACLCRTLLSHWAESENDCSSMEGRNVAEQGRPVNERACDHMNELALDEQNYHMNGMNARMVAATLLWMSKMIMNGMASE